MNEKASDTPPVELVKTNPSELMPEPDGWSIREALWETVEKIGNSPVTRQADSTNWYEAFSHGLAQPIRGLGGIAERERVKRDFWIGARMQSAIWNSKVIFFISMIMNLRGSSAIGKATP